MKLTGKHKKVSREFIRAWVSASNAVLSLHGYPLNLDTLVVQVKDLSKRVNKVNGGGVGGTASRSTNTIELSCKGSTEWVASCILHECIHLGCGNFGRGTNELCTTRLAGKLLPTVAEIAKTLQERDNNNRAYFAHTKIAYRNAPGAGDRYEHVQLDEVEDKHHARRNPTIRDLKRQEKRVKEKNRDDFHHWLDNTFFPSLSDENQAREDLNADLETVLRELALTPEGHRARTLLAMRESHRQAGHHLRVVEDVEGEENEAPR
ncbi:hypothetical protein CMI47_01120 [Candidatus Pacearchaeota archaeon]|nr:hypothetical protein [Candidatus Pacearchaeota archaeon]